MRHDPYSLFLRDIAQRYPVSYGVMFLDSGKEVIVPLTKHLHATGELMKCLFFERIKVLIDENILWGFKVENYLYTIGLLHDFGKASRYYIKLVKHDDNYNKLIISFPYHEHVIKIMLELAIYSQIINDYDIIDVFNVVAETIARHHVAYASRHPYNICSLEFGNHIVKNRIGIIAKVIKGLGEYGKIFDLLQTLNNNCKTSSFCAKYIEILEKTCKVIPEWSDKLPRVISNVYCGVRNTSNDLQNIKIIQALSGALIIADNISALFERTNFDEIDNSKRLEIPSYTLHWLYELYSDEVINCLKKLYEPKNVEIVLKRIGVMK